MGARVHFTYLLCRVCPEGEHPLFHVGQATAKKRKRLSPITWKGFCPFPSHQLMSPQFIVKEESHVRARARVRMLCACRKKWGPLLQKLGGPEGTRFVLAFLHRGARLSGCWRKARRKYTPAFFCIVFYLSHTHGGFWALCKVLRPFDVI